MSFYESDEQLSQYLAFHYGESHFGVGNYPSRCASLCVELARGRGRTSALDLGCAVGRSTLELARAFDRVDGLDLSRRFITTAGELLERGAVDYLLRDEGELSTRATARLADFGLDAVAGRVGFAVADACRLGEQYRDYDLIFAGNLIDRLHDPAAFLEAVHRHLAPGGTLVISSPYTLLESFTPRYNWLGGFERDGERVTVLDGIRSVLAPRFEMLGEPRDVPFVIRETRRKFQHSIAELTAWRLRS